MRRLLALLVLLPGLAFGQATAEDFEGLVPSGQGVTLAGQYPLLARAVQGLTPYFRGRVAEGDDPEAILTGLIFGRASGVTYSNWRVTVDSGNDLLLQVNEGSDASPSWTTRATFDPSTGLTSAPAAHVHATTDITSGTFADTRISQSSVEQWAEVDPTASRIVQGNVSAQIEPGWISETAITQHEDALELDASQVTTGTFADGRISSTSVLQHGYMLQSGDVFLRFSGSCPTGTTEYTAARGIGIRGADVNSDDVNVPDGPGVRCVGGSAPAGCGAPDSSNYSDFISTSEMPLHDHSGPNHSHNVTIPNHAHTNSTHQHTIAHTHQVTIAPHTHALTVPFGNVAADNQPPRGFPSDGTPDTNTPIGSINPGTDASGGQTVTSGAASTTNSGSGGGAATGSNGGGTFGSTTAGTGNTGSTGGTQPMLGPFVTAIFCVVN